MYFSTKSIPRKVKLDSEKLVKYKRKIVVWRKRRRRMSW